MIHVHTQITCNSVCDNDTCTALKLTVVARVNNFSLLTLGSSVFKFHNLLTKKYTCQQYNMLDSLHHPQSQTKQGHGIIIY